MLFRIFSLMLPLAATAAGKGDCEGWFHTVGLYAKDFKDDIKESAGRFRDDLKRGPQYLLVRDRTEDELAATYASYFFPKAVKAPEDAGTYAKVLRQVHNIATVPIGGGERVHVMPVRGTIESLDRLFLGSYSARGPIKFVAYGAASGAAYRYAFDEPVRKLAETRGLSNAVVYGLDHDYTFRDLRAAVEAKKLTREEALEKVKVQLLLRRNYFDLVRKEFAEHPEATIESVAPKFLNLVADEKLSPLFSDLHYLLTPAARKNPRFSFPPGPAGVTEEQYEQLFTLNHVKLFGFSAASEWLSPKFSPENLRKSDPSAYAVYREVMDDPFVRELEAAHKGGKITQPKLEELVMNDLEWKVRFAQLGVLGAKIQGPDGATLTLQDRRDYLRKENGF